MKITAKKRVSALVLSLSMLLMLGAMPVNAEAEAAPCAHTCEVCAPPATNSGPPVVAPMAAVNIGDPQGLVAGANLTGTQVYFGQYNGSPILWYVVATDSGSATLWTTTSMGRRAYDSSFDHKFWKDSEICLWLNENSSGGFLHDAFSAGEQGAMDPQYGEENEYSNQGPIDSRQTIVLPSLDEIGGELSTGTWGIECTRSVDNKRGFGDPWWLRSPRGNRNSAAWVHSVGIGSPAIGNLVHGELAIRPAFKLNLSSVLFTSAAAGGNPGAVKLTVWDTALNFTGATPTAVSGRTVTYGYAGAAPGKTLSAIVTDASGAVKSYGKLAAVDAGGSGTVTVTVPDDFTIGSDTLHIFVEQINGDYETDYVGASQTIPVASQTAPATPAGGVGEITGVDSTMEYRAVGAPSWTPITGASVPVAAGSYEVRLAGKVQGGTAYLASDAKPVTAANNPPAAGGSPQTGDGSNMGLWVLISALALAGLAAWQLVKRRARPVK